MRLLNLCGATQNFDHPFAIALRRIDHLLSQRHSGCAAELCVILLIYNTLAHAEYGKVPLVLFDL